MNSSYSHILLTLKWENPYLAFFFFLLLDQQQQCSSTVWVYRRRSYAAANNSFVENHFFLVYILWIEPSCLLPLDCCVE